MSWTRDSVNIARPVKTIAAGKQVGGTPTTVATGFRCLLELQQTLTTRVRQAGFIERDGYLMSWRQSSPAIQANDLVTETKSGKTYVAGKVQYDNIGRYYMAELKAQV